MSHAFADGTGFSQIYQMIGSGDVTPLEIRDAQITDEQVTSAIGWTLAQAGFASKMAFAMGLTVRPWLGQYLTAATHQVNVPLGSYSKYDARLVLRCMSYSIE